MVSKAALANIIESYLNDKSLWNDFQTFIEEQGYTLTELGFEDYEDS